MTSRKPNPDFITTCLWIIAKKERYLFQKANLLQITRLQLLMLKKQKKPKQNKKHCQIQLTEERKCIGAYNNITSAENYNTKMVTNSRLSSDREQERFNTHYCQSGRTQCANSQFHLAFLTLHELEKQLFSQNFRSRVSHSLSLLKKCLWKHSQRL